MFVTNILEDSNQVLTIMSTIAISQLACNVMMLPDARCSCRDEKRWGIGIQV